MINTLLTSLPPATTSHQQTIASQPQHPTLPSEGVCHGDQKSVTRSPYTGIGLGKSLPGLMENVTSGLMGLCR